MDGGIISAIASVLTKCASAVTRKKSVRPTRARLDREISKPANRPIAVSSRNGVTSNNNRNTNVIRLLISYEAEDESQVGKPQPDAQAPISKRVTSRNG